MSLRFIVNDIRNFVYHSSSYELTKKILPSKFTLRIDSCYTFYSLQQFYKDGGVYPNRQILVQTMNGIFVILKTDGDGAWGQGDRIGQEHSGEGRCEVRLKMDDDRFKLVPGGVDHLKDCHICLQDFCYQNEYIVNQQKEPLAKPDIITWPVAEEPADKPVDQPGYHNTKGGNLQCKLPVKNDTYKKNRILMIIVYDIQIIMISQVSYQFLLVRCENCYMFH